MHEPSDSSASLPEPDVAALSHSRQLLALLHRRLLMAGGWLSFADYMQAVLYEPGLGYYSAGAAKFGSAGDFVTAPEISPLFARALARALKPVLDTVPAPTILELGGGSGELAADLLLALEGKVPVRYFMLEVSADLRARQQATLAARVPRQLHQVQWLDRLPDAPMDGVILANEVVDALPVERFRVGAEGLEVLGVTATATGLGWAGRPAGAELRHAVAGLQAALPGALPVGAVGEINVRLSPWIRSLADVLSRGLLLLVDYGGSAREIYHPDQRQGTLRCFYRHRVHGDPFLWPGLQDITASVDFSALAAAGRGAGLALAAYATQAHFLLANGVLDDHGADLAAGGPANSRTAAAGRALQQLLMPGEMGERYKVMAFCREPLTLPTLRDLSASL
jgi:SAM-dependent MidA family methyltransferase